MWYTIEPLKLNRQVVAVLSYLEGEVLVEDMEDRYIYCKTSAWYNGREDGASLTVSSAAKPALIITFGEHRNSDGIFVDSWLTEKSTLNPPTVDDFTDEAYERRKMFKYGDVVGTVQYIHGLIEQYIREVAPIPAEKISK